MYRFTLNYPSMHSFSMFIWATILSREERIIAIKRFIYWICALRTKEIVSSVVSVEKCEFLIAFSFFCDFFTAFSFSACENSLSFSLWPNELEWLWLEWVHGMSRSSRQISEDEFRRGKGRKNGPISTVMFICCYFSKFLASSLATCTPCLNLFVKNLAPDFLSVCDVFYKHFINNYLLQWCNYTGTYMCVLFIQLTLTLAKKKKKKKWKIIH